MLLFLSSRLRVEQSVQSLTSKSRGPSVSKQENQEFHPNNFNVIKWSEMIILLVLQRENLLYFKGLLKVYVENTLII